MLQVILDGNFVHALLETKCAAIPLLFSSGAGTTRLFLGCLLPVCNLPQQALVSPARQARLPQARRAARGAGKAAGRASEDVRDTLLAAGAQAARRRVCW